MIQCAQCQKPFTVTPKEHTFYTKLNIPDPTLCHLCLRHRILTWRNQRTLYSRICDATKKSIISIFSPDAPYTVYDRDYWWSDAWDPTDYGADFDFTKTFAENYDALLRRVPMVGIFNAKTVNSQYCNHVGEMKDCYLAFGCWEGQKLLYGDMSLNEDTCCDVLEDAKSTKGYELIQCINCYNTNYALQSENCNDSWFLFDCKDCSDCIGCTNLRHKRYYIFNKPYSKEAYEQKKAELKLDTRSGIAATRAQFNQIKQSALHRFAYLINCEHTTGDMLIGATNSTWCFAMRAETQDCAYAINGGYKNTEVYDSYGVGVSLEKAYLCVDVGLNATENIATVVTWGSSYAYYTYNCHASFEIFGCSGIRNKKFCILNKQYSEAEYKQLKTKIINHMKKTGEWGQPPAPFVSPFAYNETLAQEYAPLNKEQVEKLGFRWQDKLPGTFGKETTATENLPETIERTPDSIAKETLACAECGRNYRITTAELEFYRLKNLPIPTHCPECRYAKRLKLRNPHYLWHRQCLCDLPNHDTHAAGATCPTEFETSYSPDRPEKIFCEYCYQKEIL